jgi:uncharacterized protein YeaO (DUF488 family)
MEAAMVYVKRAYESPADTDGRRFLVDRLWPRGVKKEALRLDGWLKDVAPSTELRRWFGHEAARWPEFTRRYRAELDAHHAQLAPLLAAAQAGDVTLVYAARDTEHNEAVVLQAYLNELLAGG